MGITLPKVHGIYKGIDPDIRLEKQVINPMITSKPRGISEVKPRLGQGRVGLKQKTFKFPVSQPLDKQEQPQLLTGRRKQKEQVYNNFKISFSLKEIKKIVQESPIIPESS